MTNDELLSKLLDNNLTELERRELDARMASSPHFAEEVREFLAVEELLVKAKPSLVSAPEYLIETVGRRTATTIAAAATTATLTSRIGQSSFQQWLTPTVAALLLSGAALTYILWPSNNNETPAVVPTTITPTQHAPAAMQNTVATDKQTTALQENEALHGQQEVTPAPTRTEQYTLAHEQQTVPHAAQVHSTAQANSAAQANSTTQQTATASAPRQMPETQPKDSSREFSITKQADTPQEQELARQLELYKSSQTMSSQILQMSTAKKIGILYRELKQYTGSRQYLERAREIAHTLHIEEEEAIAIGELGLLEKEQGNQLQAVQLVQQCVNRLEEQQSPSLQRWQEELQALQGKK